MLKAFRLFLLQNKKKLQEDWSKIRKWIRIQFMNPAIYILIVWWWGTRKDREKKTQRKRIKKKEERRMENGEEWRMGKRKRRIKKLTWHSHCYKSSDFLNIINESEWNGKVQNEFVVVTKSNQWNEMAH